MNWLNLILSDILSTLTIFIIIKKLASEDTTFKKDILFIISTFVLYLINYSFLNGIYKTIVSFFTILLTSYIFIFDKNISKSIYYSFCVILFCLFGEIFTTIILTTCFSYTIEKYNLGRFSLLFYSFLVFIFSMFLLSIKPINIKLNKMEKYIITNRIDNFYLISLMILLFLMGFNNSISFAKDITYYINVLIIFIALLIIIVFILNKVRMIRTELKYEEMMEYVSKYEKIINEQGKKNHEFNNQLMVLSGYINNKKKLKEYLDSIIDEHKGGKNYTIEQLSYFPDGGIKGIIYHKFSKMDEYDIKPYLYIDKNSKEIFETKFDVKLYSDITKLFGVYIDNAIEAAKDAKTKEVEIDMKVDKDYLIITISNTYPESIDTDKIGKKGFSTKGKGHGFGLSLVKDIAKSNNKIETITDITNNMFKQIILIDLK